MSFFETVVKIIEKYWKQLLLGMGNTLLIALISTLIGLLIGILIGVIRTVPYSKNPIVRAFQKLVNFLLVCYIEIFRGTPMMVQAMVIYWGYAFATHGQTLPLVPSAIFIVSINTGAYMAEIVRGGIISVDKGQFEATHSIGMTHFQSMLYVILPQAIRNILPATGNQFIINIKDSCVLSVISVTELFFQTKSAAGATFQTFPAYFIACVIYFVLCFSITQILRKLETRMDGSETYTIYGTEPVINGADTLKRGDTR